MRRGGAVHTGQHRGGVGAGAHQPGQMPYCVCMMSWGSSSYSRKKPMEPKATPHRAACKRWGVVGGGAGCGGLSETRLVCTGRRRGGGRRWGRARAGDGPVDETPGRAWANVRARQARQVGSCVRQRERDDSGKRAARAAPRTRRTLAVVGGGHAPESRASTWT